MIISYPHDMKVRGDVSHSANRRTKMKNVGTIIAAMMVCALMSGCGNFWGGMAGGAVGTGAGYELKARQQMDKLDEDLKKGRIDEKEYEIRKNQIERGSLVY